jgi:hypothetical protein
MKPVLRIVDCLRRERGLSDLVYVDAEAIDDFVVAIGPSVRRFVDG